MPSTVDGKQGSQWQADITIVKSSQRIETASEILQQNSVINTTPVSPKLPSNHRKLKSCLSGMYNGTG